MLITNLFPYESPVAQILDICVKYKILTNVTDVILSGKLPSKQKWKKWISNVVDDNHFALWRRELTLYANLYTFRGVVISVEPCVWWVTCKEEKRLKYACSLILRLLTGSSVLRVHFDTSIPRVNRICKYCSLNEIEDVEHFVMRCSLYSDKRDLFVNRVNQNVSELSANKLAQMSDYICFMIFMGMNFDMCIEDLFTIRMLSVCYIKEIYIKRKSLQK